MKKILLLPFVLLAFASNAVKVTIIESQSSGNGMDQKWLTNATSLGYTAAIFPQTTLNSNTFFSTTDVLIVSSGIIPLPANRVAIILQFLQQGGKVYLQSEYLMSYDTDQAFAYLVNALGGSFNWIANISGNLQPMTVLGSLANTYTTVTPLTYFWYGVAGCPGSNVEPFLLYQGQYFGFIFCPPSPGIGKLITTTDQDWIQSGSNNEANLMKNILTNLLDTNYNCSSNNYPHLNLGSDTTLCAGDSIILNAKSGFTTYQWQNGSTDSVFTVHIAGTYWVAVTTPCSTSRDTIVISPKSCSALPVADFTSSDTVFCNEAGKCIDFTDYSSGNPTGWKWHFTGAQPDSSDQQNPKNICYYTPGTFPVTLIVTNGAGTDTLDVQPLIILTTPPPAPTIWISHDTIFCTHASFYQWYYNGSPIAGATDSFYVFTNGGTYSALITDGNGCSSLSNGLLITGFAQFTFGEGLGIRPNPAKENFTIYGLNPAAEVVIEIYNIIGEKIYSQSMRAQGAKQATVPCGNFSKGLYFLHISEEERQYIGRVIIE